MSSMTGPTGCTRALRLQSWHPPITQRSLVPSRRTLPAADKGAATGRGKAAVAAMVAARAVARNGGPPQRWNNPWLTHFARQRMGGTYSSQGETQ